jgi:hypothetical protein
MQGLISRYGMQYEDNHAGEAIVFADKLINQLKKNPKK